MLKRVGEYFLSCGPRAFEPSGGGECLELFDSPIEPRFAGLSIPGPRGGGDDGRSATARIVELLPVSKWGPGLNGDV